MRTKTVCVVENDSADLGCGFSCFRAVGESAMIGRTFQRDVDSI
jgi:hypothetical protein